MLDRAFQDDGHYLHISMSVLGQSRPGNDAVLVEHPEVTKSHMLGIVVVGEREAMLGIDLPAPMATASASVPETDHVPVIPGVAASASRSLPLRDALRR